MKIDKIDKCEGYIWYSDSKEPIVYRKEACEINIEDFANPFIIEGFLYDLENKISYSIKYVDGAYYLNSFDLSNDNSPVESYFSSFDPKLKLEFIRRWEAKEDDKCAGMKTLKPSCLIFKGFTEIKK